MKYFFAPRPLPGLPTLTRHLRAFRASESGATTTDFVIMAAMGVALAAVTVAMTRDGAEVNTTKTAASLEQNNTTMFGKLREGQRAVAREFNSSQGDSSSSGEYNGQDPYDSGQPSSGNGEASGGQNGGAAESDTETSDQETTDAEQNSEDAGTETADTETDAGDTGTSETDTASNEGSDADNDNEDNDRGDGGDDNDFAELEEEEEEDKAKRCTPGRERKGEC